MFMRISTLSSGVLVAGALALAGPASAQSAGDILKGGAIGGLGGAAVGAIVPGLSTGDGALIGAAGGAVIGGVNGSKKDKRHRRYHRDDRGSSYWVDKHGKRHYRR
jgi:outer membrane lipoprotein SlyB